MHLVCLFLVFVQRSVAEIRSSGVQARVTSWGPSALNRSVFFWVRGVSELLSREHRCHLQSRVEGVPLLAACCAEAFGRLFDDLVDWGLV